MAGAVNGRTWIEPRECVGCGNRIEMMVDGHGDMTCPICGHVILADDAEKGDSG